MDYSGCRFCDEGRDHPPSAWCLRDRERKAAVALQIRVIELETSIRKHREATGHQMCHENDEELYLVLKDGIKIDHRPPPRCEFRKKCREYYESREGAEKTEDGW